MHDRVGRCSTCTGGTQSRQRIVERRQAPFGYTIDPETQRLNPNETEAAIVRLIFRLYTHDRLGSKTIARVLNNRGLLTTTSGTWSTHQVLRVLANRVCIGELISRTPATTPRSAMDTASTLTPSNPPCSTRWPSSTATTTRSSPTQ